jgi:putative transcriptional regulator
LNYFNIKKGINLYKVSERIRLIAAAPDSIDPVFKQSLVVVIENMNEGAFGFIVNKESDILMNEIYSGETPLSSSTLYAWEGGPVDDTRGFLMAKSEYVKHLGFEESFEAEETLNFADSIQVISNTDTVKAFLDQYKESVDVYLPTHPNRTIAGAVAAEERRNYPFKFLMGYSGWDIDQLDDEINDGTWLEIPFDEKLIFDTAPENSWRLALASVGLVNIESYQAPTSDWLN